MTSVTSKARRHLAWGIGIWALLAVCMAGIVLRSTPERTVVNAYRLGADRWLSGKPLYNTTGHGFLYFPQAAILFIPWSILPHWWGEVLWRTFSILSLAISTASLCKTAASNRWETSFLRVSLVGMIFSLAAVRSGQMTVVMTACLLFCLSDLMQARWTRAAGWLWLGFALKPIILPCLLLVTALWIRQLGWRMIVGGLLTAALPFLFQSPGYVWEQYRLLPAMLQSAHDLGHRELFPHLFGMLEVLGGHLPEHFHTITRAIAGLATLILAAVMKRRMTTRDFVLFLGAFAAGYILLFNPRTESSTYLLIGPFIGYSLDRCQDQGRRVDVALLSIITTFIIGNYELGQHLFSGNGIHVLAPFATILFLAWLLREPRRSDTGDQPNSSALESANSPS